MTRWVAGLCVALCFTCVQAQSSPKSRLAQKLNALHAFQAHFKASQTEGEAQTGDCAFLKPNQFFWHIQTPSEEWVLTDGTTLWHYDPLLEQATAQPFSSDAQHASPLMWLTESPEKVLGAYDVIEEHDGKTVRYHLSAHADDALLESVSVSFCPDVCEMQFNHRDFGENRVTFSKVTYHPKLSDKQFQFKAPKGVLILKQA